MCVCLHACVRVYASVRACTCVHASVRMRVCIQSTIIQILVVKLLSQL